MLRESPEGRRGGPIPGDPVHKPGSFPRRNEPRRVPAGSNPGKWDRAEEAPDRGEAACSGDHQPHRHADHRRLRKMRMRRPCPRLRGTVRERACS